MTRNISFEIQNRQLVWLGISVRTPLLPNPDPNEGVTSVINGTVNILTAAAREPSVKRFVLTSSTHATAEPKTRVAREIDETSWNEDAIKEAWAPPPFELLPRMMAVYAASKAQGEQAMWKWVEENKPAFTVNSGECFFLELVHDQLYWLRVDHTTTRLAQEEQAVAQALRLGPDLGEAHLARAMLLFHGSLDFAGARAELAVARKALPNSPEVLAVTSYLCLPTSSYRHLLSETRPPQGARKTNNSKRDVLVVSSLFNTILSLTQVQHKAIVRP